MPKELIHRVNLVIRLEEYYTLIYSAQEKYNLAVLYGFGVL